MDLDNIDPDFAPKRQTVGAGAAPAAATYGSSSASSYELLLRRQFFEAHQGGGAGGSTIPTSLDAENTGGPAGDKKNICRGVHRVRLRSESDGGTNRSRGSMRGWSCATATLPTRAVRARV